tara:strand:- start:2632 stop:3063 length:432 start_codon:yes stop_codon:yes gene_type:complete
MPISWATCTVYAVYFVFGCALGLGYMAFQTNLVPPPWKHAPLPTAAAVLTSTNNLTVTATTLTFSCSAYTLGAREPFMPDVVWTTETDCTKLDTFAKATVVVDGAQHDVVITELANASDTVHMQSITGIDPSSYAPWSMILTM